MCARARACVRACVRARSPNLCVSSRSVTRITVEIILIYDPEVPGSDLSRETTDPEYDRSQYV